MKPVKLDDAPYELQFRQGGSSVLNQVTVGEREPPTAVRAQILSPSRRPTRKNLQAWWHLPPGRRYTLVWIRAWRVPQETRAGWTPPRPAASSHRDALQIAGQVKAPRAAGLVTVIFYAWAIFNIGVIWEASYLASNTMAR